VGLIVCCARTGHYDLAGFAVGAASRADLLPKLELIAAGDVLIGLPSSGVHSNGFSLVRRSVERAGLGWGEAAPFDPQNTLARALLTPVRRCELNLRLVLLPPALPVPTARRPARRHACTCAGASRRPAAAR